MPKNAIVTLLYEPSYIPGALVLGISLRKLLKNSHTSPAVELAILIDEEKFTPYQKSLLTEIYDVLLPVQALTSTLVEKLHHDLGRPELANTFTKIALWNLNQYQKILYLDADTLPEWEASPSTANGTILDLFRLDFPSNKILAVPDSGFPDIFNSGVFMLQPNANDYHNLFQLVTHPDNKNSANSVSFDGADQGLLNQYFNPQPNWVADVLGLSLGDSVHAVGCENSSFDVSDSNSSHHSISSNWIKLPFLYNVTPSAQYQYLPAYKYFTESTTPGDLAAGSTAPGEGNVSAVDAAVSETKARYGNAASSYFQGGNLIKLVHFIGPYKPWSSPEIQPLHQKWWDVWHGYFGPQLSIDSVVFWENGAKHLDPAVLGNLYFEKGRDSGKRQNVGHVQEVSPPIAQKAATVETPIAHEVHHHQQHPSRASETFVSDPQHLCRPEHYQSIVSDIQPTDDSLWDATKDAPPVGHIEDEQHEAASSFEKEMHKFENSWDQPGGDDQDDKVAVAIEAEPKPEPFPIKDFHREYVAPERVFYASVDFPIPISSSPEDQLQESEELHGDNEEDDDIARLESIGRADREEVKQEKENEEETEEEEVPYYEKPFSNLGRIFPWEFRDYEPPERIFEDY